MSETYGKCNNKQFTFPLKLETNCWDLKIVFCCPQQSRRLAQQSPIVVEASAITKEMTQNIHILLYLESEQHCIIYWCCCFKTACK